MTEEEEWRRLGRLLPEQKVQIMMDMTDGCVRICADGIRQQHPGISEKELLEKLRKATVGRRQPIGACF